MVNITGNLSWEYCWDNVSCVFGRMLKHFITFNHKFYFNMWAEENGKLVNRYEFKDFKAAILFINELAKFVMR